VDEELIGWSYPEDSGQRLDIQMDTSDKWGSAGVHTGTSDVEYFYQSGKIKIDLKAYKTSSSIVCSRSKPQSNIIYSLLKVVRSYTLLCL